MDSRELATTPWATDSRLKAYYRFSTGALTTDSSGNGHTLTAVSDPAEVAGVFGKAAEFDPDDAYSIADHADFKPTGRFTVGCWIKTTSTSVVPMQSWSQNTNLAGWRLRVSAGGALQFYIGKNTGSTVNVDYWAATGGTINDGNWHFIVGTYDGSKVMRAYVDGFPGTPVTAEDPAYAATNYVRFGCGNQTGTNTYFLNGTLDDAFIIVGYALGAEDVKKIYFNTASSFLLNIAGNWKNN